MVTAVASIGTIVRWIAILASVFVALGFLAFAVDEMDRGSQEQQNELAQGLKDLDPEDAAAIGAPDPSPVAERAREREHGSVREAIDDVNDVLLAPFAGLIESDNGWVNHGVPSLLALLVYGLGLGTLANMLPKARAPGGDWRTA
jgi:hypothetical protein